MALNIKKPETYKLAEELAELTGESMTQAVTQALSERLKRVRQSAVNYVEAAAVIDGSRDPVASRRFDDLLRAAQVILEPVTEAQAQIAREAYRDFGKRSGHPASLDFGDCFSYALAKAMAEPLLFKGDDFPHTDVMSALA
jgi:ribonuclease VapC